ncbi:hypothetical protein [Nostoc sp.]
MRRVKSDRISHLVANGFFGVEERSHWMRGLRAIANTYSVGSSLPMPSDRSLALTSSQFCPQ